MDAGRMKRLRASVVASCALLAAASCGGDDVPQGALPPAPTATVAAAIAGDGCAADAAGKPGRTMWRVPIDFGASEVLVDVPAAYRAGVPLPLVLNLHGGQTTADAPRDHARYTGLAAVGEAHGFIVVTPATVGVAALHVTLDRVQAQWCIDRARVYAAGLSRGAGLAMSLSCTSPRRVAAIATVAGLRYTALACDDTPPLPMIAFHGTADRITPFDAAVESAQRWAAHNGCAPNARPQAVVGPVTLTRYARCAADAAVEFYAIEGDGHTWAGAAQPGSAADETTQLVSANELLWAFFAPRRLAR